MKTLNTLILSGLLAFGLIIPAKSATVEPAWFSQAELDQMLAPVALYPDTVLSHVLIAATYPLEVVEAARWSRANPGLSGEAAVAAVEPMVWDPSVKALVAFPELLQRMDEDLEWTRRLGDAFLMQEEEVLDSIQHLRAEAYAHGALRTNEYVRVVRETEYIYIEPARTRVVYVPYYDPYAVYPRWRWAHYPPVYWPHPPGYHVSLTFFWGSGFHVAPAHFYFSSFHWPRRHVVAVHHHKHRHFTSGHEIARHSDARRWQHNPKHRHGVSYRHGVDRSRFERQSATPLSRGALADAARSPDDRRSQSIDGRAGTRSHTNIAAAREDGSVSVNRDRQRAGVRSALRERVPASSGPTQRSTPSRPDASTLRETIRERNGTRSRPSSNVLQAEAPRERPSVAERAPSRRADVRSSAPRRAEPSARSSSQRQPAAISRQLRKSPVASAPTQRPKAAAPRPSRSAQAAPSPPQRPSRNAPDRSRPASAPARQDTPRVTQPQRGASAGRSAPVQQRNAPARRSASEQRPERRARQASQSRRGGRPNSP